MSDVTPGDRDAGPATPEPDAAAPGADAAAPKAGAVAPEGRTGTPAWRSGRRPLALVAAVLVVSAVAAGVAVRYRGDHDTGGGSLRELWSAGYVGAVEESEVGRDALRGAWLVDGLVVRAKRDGLLAYRVADGTVAWRLAAPVGREVCGAAPTAEAEGRTAVALSDGKDCTAVAGVDLRRGALLWQAPLPGTARAATYLPGAGVALAVADGRVLANDHGDALYAHAVDTGRRLWSFRDPDRTCGVAGAGLDATSAVTGSRCTGGRHAVGVLDAATGGPRWRTALPGPGAVSAVVATAPPVVEVDGDALVVAFTADGRVRGVAPRQLDGRRLTFVGDSAPAVLRNSRVLVHDDLFYVAYAGEDATVRPVDLRGRGRGDATGLGRATIALTRGDGGVYALVTGVEQGGDERPRLLRIGADGGIRQVAAGTATALDRINEAVVFVHDGTYLVLPLRRVLDTPAVLAVRPA